MTPRRLFQLALKPLTLAVALALPAHAAEPARLLYPVAVNGFAEAGRSAVRFDPERAFNLAPGSELVLTVPGRGDYSAVFERAEMHANGDRTWVGFLKGHGNDYRVLLTHGAAGTVGRIATPQGLINVSTGNGFSVMTDVEAAGLKAAIIDDIDEIAGLKQTLSSVPIKPESRFAAAQQEIDLMVLYSRELNTSLGASAMQTQINNLVALANQAYIDSNIPLKVRVVHSQQVDYGDAVSLNTALTTLTQGQGPFGFVAAKRKEVGADLVTLLRRYLPDSDSSCGLAYVLGSGKGGEDAVSRSAANAFSVVSFGKEPNANPNGYRYCADLTLAHELGHNMGSTHDRAHARTQNGAQTYGAFDYSFGYGFDGSFGTVMSYINPGVGKFSGPSLTCAGQACGISETDTNNSANNALSITKTAPYIAAFMPRADKPVAELGKVQFLAATAQVQENAGNLAIQVGRSGDTSVAASVQWTLASGTATVGRDLTGPTSGTLNWAANDSSVKTIMIPIADDTEVEAAETFTVTLQNPSGVEIGATNRVTATINDNDTQQVTFALAPAAVTASEGDGEVRFTVSLTGSHANPVSVRYATRAGTAAATTDFEAANGTLTWAAGDNADKTVTVNLVEDEAVEKDETFYLDLSTPSGGQIGAGSSTVTVRDNDTVVEESIVEFESASIRAVEGDRKAVLKVRRTGSTPLTVRVATADGTALAGADYQSSDRVVSWADGDRDSKTVEIALIDDNEAESEEKFTVVLSQADGGRVGKTATATVNLVDDDKAGAITLGFDKQEYEIDEKAGVLRVGVKRGGSTVGAVSVKFATASGTAFEGDDFTMVTKTLNWADGDGTAKLIEVPIIDDQLVEGTENFELLLSEAVGATLASDRVIVNLLDDDKAEPGTVSFDPATYTVDEQAGVARITLKRSGLDSAAASVRVVTRAGTATEGSDFTAIDQTVGWGEGDVIDKVIEVPIIDDTQVESREAFDLTLSEPVGVKLGSATTATVSILDNDSTTGEGLVGFEAGQYRVDENGKAVRLTVRRSGSLTSAASVRIQTVAGTAVNGSDYVELDQTLSWGANDSTPKTVDVQIVDDNVKETLESFYVQLSAPTGVTLGDLSRAQVDIADNDGSACPQELCFDSLPSVLVSHLDTLTFAVNIDWNKLTMRKIAAVDLWMAIRLADGNILYLNDVAGVTSFSTVPGPYRRTLTTGTNYVAALDKMPLSADLRGGYTFYTLLMKSGSGLETFPGQAASQLRSQPVVVR